MIANVQKYDLCINHLNNLSDLLIIKNCQYLSFSLNNLARWQVISKKLLLLHINTF